jgi:hypothetical protein
MKSENLLRLMGLGLRLAETVASRAPARPARPESRGDRLVARVAPVAERALARTAPGSARRAKKRRRASTARLAAAGLFGAASAGTIAYLVARQQQRVRERYRLLQPSFPAELLDVLAAPGGGGRLEYSGTRLIDRQTGAGYILVDGIPDFIAPLAASSAEPALDGGWLTDLARPIAMRVLGRSTAGDGACASAAALAAGDGWTLSVPAGRGTFELEMARANPRGRVLCLSKDWDTLLEIRRRALEAGVKNIYYVRGLPRLLPLRDGSMAGLWTGSGLHRYATPERELTQMLRVARRGAVVAGTSLVLGAGPIYDALLRLAGPYLRGVRSEVSHFALLQAAGLGDIRLFRDGAFLRFTAVRV